VRYPVWKSKFSTEIESISKEEKQFFQFLDDHIYKGHLENIFYHARRGPCFKFEDSIIIPDIVDNNIKLIIEYYGDFWHTNPRVFDSSYIHPISKLTSEQIWAKDKKRIDYFTSLGYDVKVVWSSEFKDNKKKVLEEIKKFYENSKN
jgi:G:T-mismatch repair DNA endonuclease (very short patch repair protein)